MKSIVKCNNCGALNSNVTGMSCGLEVDYCSFCGEPENFIKVQEDSWQGEQDEIDKKADDDNELLKERDWK